MKEFAKKELMEDDLFKVSGGVSNYKRKKTASMVFCPECNKTVNVKSSFNGGFVCVNDHTIYDA